MLTQADGLLDEVQDLRVLQPYVDPRQPGVAAFSDPTMYRSHL